MSDSPHIDTLKRFLIDLPSAHNFQLTDSAKKDIRRALFLAVSENGKYFDWLFPKLTAGSTSSSSISNILEKELQWLFGNYDRYASKIRDAKHSGHNNHAYHFKLPCARIFRRGEPIYKCLTCGFDDTCALCSYCYQPENHQGHAVHVTVCQRESGGVCDCGDPEAWVNEFQCKYAEEDKDYASFRSREVPDDLAQSLFRTIEIVLDYIIDVMCQSDLQFYSPWDVAMYPGKYSTNCTLNPKKYGYPDVDDIYYDKPSEKFSLIAYNDQVRHFRDAVQRIHLASKKVSDFATMVAQKVQNHGRATVIRSRDINLLSERQKILSATGLASCIRNARDEFREDMCHEIILWVASLTECEMFRSNTTLKNLFCKAFCCKWSKGLLATHSNSPVDYVRGKLDTSFRIPSVESIEERNLKVSHWSFNPSPWNISADMSADCGYTQISRELNQHLGSRFQYLVYLDIRFWKSIRILLHDLYATCLITNLKYKGLICCLYVDIYPAITDMFLSIDGEPEVNIMCTLSIQLFTCPSNSTSIIAHGDVSRFFSAIHSFLKTGLIKASKYPANDRNKILMSSLKNRRWGQVFFDIGYILNRGKDRELILTSSIIPMACDILVLFQGKPVMKREKENHVEYESSDYTAFFHAILVIYQFAEYIAHCITNLDQHQREQVSQNAISYVIIYLLKLEEWNQDDNPGDFNDVDYGQHIELVSLDGTAELPKTTLDDAKVSFLHPIHSFLSWLIEFSSFGTSTKLLSVFTDTITGFIAENLKSASLSSCIISIFDYPIRTIVLSSQIKSGLWVRNGFSARSQLQLYKNTALREQGYLRDLFLVQVFSVCSTPDTIAELFLKRWLLFYGWSDGTTINSFPYEPTALPYIIEEFLNFIIHILTEDFFIQGLSSEETTYIKVKNEIIHNLCFGPMSYSRLCSQIPEHVSAEKRFDMILEELTTFKGPKTPKDTGTYSLKEMYMDELNPYYFNYTTNKKDDAINFVKERIHKSTALHFHDISIKPKLRNPNIGIFKHMGSFTASPLFANFLIRTIKYIIDEGADKLDGLLETTLHLIHVIALEGTINESFDFFPTFCELSRSFDTSLAAQAFAILANEEFKNHHAKIRAILGVFSSRNDDAILALTRIVPGFSPSKLLLVPEQEICENEFERKKRVAKERQAKLMAKFKKQQSLFVKMNNVCTDCSDTEMEEIEEAEGWRFPDPHCILCQDTAEDAGPFGIISYISKSSEFRDLPFDDEYWFLKSFSDSSSLNGSESLDSIPEHRSDNWRKFMKKVEAEHVIGPGFSDRRFVHSKLVSLTCGHGMHFNCYMQFLASSRSRLSQITRNTPDSIEHREFLCPLCKAINNMFIPILWTSNNRSLGQFLKPSNQQVSPFDLLQAQTIHDEAWFQQFCQRTTEDLEKFSILAPAAKEMIGSNSDAHSLPNQQQFRLLLSNMFQILSLLTFPQIFKADSPNVLINSIKSTEISLRGTGSNSDLVIFQLSNNTLINLRALNEFRVTSLLMKISNWIQLPSTKPDAHVKLLANLLTLSPEFFNHSVMNSDFFETLVNLLPFPSTEFSFNAILCACYVGTVIQNAYLLTTQLLSNNFFTNEDYNVLDVPFSEMITQADAQRATELFMKMCLGDYEYSAHNPIVQDVKFGYVFYSMLLKSLTPFLRQSAIYSYVCCSNEAIIRKLSDELELEVDSLCSFLNIPHLCQIIDKMVSNQAEPSWEGTRFLSFLSYVRKPHGKSMIDDNRMGRSMDFPGIVRLAELPERLDHFFTQYYYLDKYQNPALTIENPAICLSCSEVMDVQKNAVGSQYGQCTIHYLKECASNAGIFLIPKDRCLLLLHRNGGSFHDAPYLDQHGELPGENKKGKPVYLLRERYEDFTKNVWLQHNIPNYIVRKLDCVIDAGGWDTL